MTKETTGEYRVWPERFEHMDYDTGELLYSLSGRFRQYAGADARPGFQYAVRSVTSNYHLDKLAFAGRDEGRAALADLRYDALRDLPHSMRKLRQHGFSGRLNVPPLELDSGSMWTRDYSYRVERDEVRKYLKRPWKV